MYKLILFDLDGTIVDTDQMIIATYTELFKIFKNISNPDINHILTFSGPPTFDTMVNEFPEYDPHVMEEEYKKRSKKYQIKYTKAYPYTKKMLLDLKELNIHVGLVTNKPKQETIWTLNHTGLNDIFEIIICPEDVKNCKPNPEGILLAINHFNVNLEDTLYVGDGERDYLSSKNANIDFAFVNWSPRKISNQQYIKYHISSYKNFIKEIGIGND